MYVVIQENHVTYDYGYSVSKVFGPFSDYNAAIAFRNRKEAEDQYGQEFSICNIETV